mgnify:FL=1
MSDDVPDTTSDQSKVAVEVDKTVLSTGLICVGVPSVVVVCAPTKRGENASIIPRVIFVIEFIKIDDE